MSTRLTVVHLQGVSKHYDAIAAVKNVDIELYEGEFFALLGPSGCGKTTLLRMIAGFEKPDQGRILLDGKDITGIRANKRPVNLMFQSYALFPHMNVRSNISYGLEMERLSRPEINRRTDEILEKTQLQNYALRKPANLSGGQKQRVALARALIKRPRVLLLDEPLGALDKKLREQMQLELKRLQHELGLTFVVVTHDQDEALVMADRIALMKDGQVIQAADPRVLYEQPQTRFVADFIGISNFLRGTLVNGGLDVPGHGVIPVRNEQNLGVGDVVDLALRPERIRLSKDERLPMHSAVHGEIIDLAYHGQDIKLIINVTNVADPIVVRITTEEEDRNRFGPGQTVWCNWLPEHGRLLTH